MKKEREKINGKRKEQRGGGRKKQQTPNMGGEKTKVGGPLFGRSPESPVGLLY